MEKVVVISTFDVVLSACSYKRGEEVVGQRVRWITKHIIARRQ